VRVSNARYASEGGRAILMFDELTPPE
jgi:hypothetical protein